MEALWFTIGVILLGTVIAAIETAGRKGSGNR